MPISESDLIELYQSNITKANKVAWSRKKQKAKKIHKEIEDIERQIINLQLRKQPIIDELAIHVQEMKQECIHPEDELLIDLDNKILTCKFCGKRIKVNLIK